ncbi:maltose operon protein MalM [Haemophilus parahaemolyticus]|uniref:maltose operon protein MalM n=1 Tax=Haemophilus parahaemolyticus TaxID=735 RepID=UPI0028E3C87F|nr:maltose operon protein MalM [Haemophilus parahaemolyticus]
MKFKLSLLFSALALSSAIFANEPSKTELANFNWQAVDLSQKITSDVNEAKIVAFAKNLAGTDSAVIGYKIPANQGTLNIKIKSLVVDNNHIFVPNVLVLDSNYNVSLKYPASQFKKAEERGLEGNQLQAELSLTPVSGQDFVYVLLYTTEQDLNGQTQFTHPAKLYEKAKGNQPPAIADIMVKHTNSGKIELEVDGIQSTQFVGLGNIAKGSAIFESKAQTAPTQSVGEEKPTASKMQKSVKNEPLAQPVEQTTEQYFNQAVKSALKNHDINKAMNLVNEAEKLGLTQPRKIFLQQVSSK